METHKTPGGYNGGRVGGLWMIHNAYKTLDFSGKLHEKRNVLLGMIAAALPSNTSLGSPGHDGFFHIKGCGSPEYHYVPFRVAVMQDVC
jgi:hypothetical protein